MKINFTHKHSLLIAARCGIFTLLLVFCQLAAQAQSISLHRNSLTLDELFEHLRTVTSYDFVYNETLLRNTKPVNISVDNVSLEQVLAIAFQDQPVSYVIREKTVVIQPRRARQPQVDTQRKIYGHVRDERGNGLSGVTISLFIRQQQFLAVVSAEDGYFEFPFVADASTLRAQHLGYKDQVLKIDPAKNNTYQIAMASQDKQIEEVVVTGLFNRPVENFTGAATTITGEDLRKVSTVDIFKSVAALDPAFNINVNNVTGGNINQMPQVQIRGQNSFPTLSDDVSSNPNQPLFILDGFEVTIDRIKDLDINLINTVVILKDASATAIYGSRGANGVMVINTKAPLPGKIAVSVINDFSITTPNLSVYQMLDARQKLDYEQGLGIYRSEEPNQQYALTQLYNQRLRAVEGGINTDWRNLAVQAGILNRTSVSLTGGDSTIRYGIHAGTNFQHGVMKGQDRTNYQAQFDFSYLLNKLRFSNSARFYQTTANESPYGSFGTYLNMNPYWSPYDANNQTPYYLEEFVATGDYNYTYNVTNPLYNASLGIINRNKTLGLQNNFNIRYDILPSLFLESRIGIIKEFGSSDNFLPGSHTSFERVTDPAQRGSYTKGQSERLNYEFATFVNFRKNWNKHLLFSTFSFELGSNRNDGYTVRAVGFATDNLNHLLYASQYDPNTRPTGTENTNNRVGMLLNGNYSYDNRYLLDLSIRRDGSSMYGTDRKFGDFWSVGLGWNLHKENFLKNVSAIDRLRLRTTYGATGSLEIPPYSALTQYTYSVSNTYDGNIGVALENIGNPNLGWQQKNELNAGLDLEMLNTRFTLRAEYYHSITSQAITQLTLAPSVGANSYHENFGKIGNQGVELALQYRLINDSRRNIFWTLFANGLHNKNTLLEISDNLQSLNERLNAQSRTIPNFLYQEGESTTTLYAVPSLGIDPVTGDEVFQKRDGTATFAWSAADKVAVGNTLPKWQGTFGTNFFYRGFEFSAMLNYRWGGQIYNQTLVDRVENINPFLNVDARAYNNAWRQPGDNALYRRIRVSRINNYTYISTRFVENENYLSIASLSVGYLFDRQQFVKRAGFNSIRVRLLSNDLAEFSSVQIERGTTNPFARTYSLSINASF